MSGFIYWISTEEKQQELRRKLREAELKGSADLATLKIQEEELKKQEEEFKLKEEELKKKERVIDVKLIIHFNITFNKLIWFPSWHHGMLIP